MVSFRKLKLGDLDPIYKDPELRPLITTAYKGNSFAVVIEFENKIIGGASGYVINSLSFLKKVIIKNSEYRSLYMDGLIRSLIHFLELDGINFLFVEDSNQIYLNIGFNKLQGSEDFIKEYPDIKIQFDRESKHIYWINVKDFFK